MSKLTRIGWYVLGVVELAVLVWLLPIIWPLICELILEAWRQLTWQ